MALGEHRQLHNAGHQLRLVSLPARGSQRTTARRAARHKRAHMLDIDAQPGGQAVDDNPHRLGMRLAEHGYFQFFSK